MPAVSVVIPTFNGQRLLAKNFPSILKSLRDGDEVILVEDGEAKETLKWLRQKYDLKKKEEKHVFSLYQGRYAIKNKKVIIKYVVNHQNLRFAGNSNRGVRLAQHPLIYLVNNDVSNYPNTIEKLVPYFEDEDVFAVGCLEYDHGNGGEESGKNKIWFERGMFIHSRADDLEFGETAWASGGSAMYDRQKWLELGGFDLNFYPAYWEDIDLSYRARKKGWRVLFEPAAKVDHNHETTNTSVFGQLKMRQISWRNANTFAWKHADFWQKIAHLLWKPYWWVKRLASNLKMRQQARAEAKKED